MPLAGATGIDHHPLVLTIARHPHLEVGAFTATLDRPLAELPSPSWLVELLRPEAAPALPEATTAAVRDALRAHGYQPTGRGKPPSEYLRRAAAERALASINVLVDACNAASLASGLPVWVVALDRLTPPLQIDAAAPGAGYPFNASGQIIDVAGLPCLHDADGPCANAVKDAQRFAKEKNATAAQIALAWLLERKPWIVHIPGTRRLDHLEENLGAIDVELSPADLRAIDGELATIAVHGGRMSEQQMRAVDQQGRRKHHRPVRGTGRQFKSG